MAHYLVTGGCGFIGSHLVEYLVNKGNSVRVLDNLSVGHRFVLPSGCDLIVGDVRDAHTVREAMDGVDGCFHLAAMHSGDLGEESRRICHETNVGGMINIINAAKLVSAQRPPRIVYASSATVYGDNAGEPLTESAETRPLSAYGADKAACEFEARIASIQHGLPTVGLRLFNVYGPRQHCESPYGIDLWHAIHALSSDKPIVLGGDGQEGCDWIYVEDVPPFFDAAMSWDGLGPELFNVCSGKVTPSSHLLRLLAALLHKEPRVDHSRRGRKMIYTVAGDPNKARSQLHCEANTGLGAGVRKIVEYWLGESPTKKERPAQPLFGGGYLEQPG